MSETSKINGNVSSPTDPVEDDEVIYSPPVSETYEQVEDLLEKVESYNPVIPDAVTDNILQSAGFESSSPEVILALNFCSLKLSTS